jgi:hypothetical protein
MGGKFMNRYLFAVIASASTLVACGGGVGIESSGASLLGATPVSEEAEASKEPLGTFEGSGGEPGEIVRLVLMDDKTAHIEMRVYCQGAALPCPAAEIDGFYNLSGSDEVKHLELFDQESVSLFARDYRYDGQVLEVTQLDENAGWQPLAPAPAWCKVAAQCEQQGLPQPSFAGEWACVNSSCQYQAIDRGLDLEP